MSHDLPSIKSQRPVELLGFLGDGKTVVIASLGQALSRDKMMRATELNMWQHAA
jgi:hypothetical protein